MDLKVKSIKYTVACQTDHQHALREDVEGTTLPTIESVICFLTDLHRIPQGLHVILEAISSAGLVDWAPYIARITTKCHWSFQVQVGTASAVPPFGNQFGSTLICRSACFSLPADVLIETIAF